MAKKKKQRPKVEVFKLEELFAEPKPNTRRSDTSLSPSLLDKCQNRPKIEIFQLEEIVSEPFISHPTPSFWGKCQNILADIGGSMAGTWVTPIIGLFLFTAVFIGGLFAFLFLLGFVFEIGGKVLGGLLNLFYYHPLAGLLLAGGLGGLWLAKSTTGNTPPAQQPPVQSPLPEQPPAQVQMPKNNQETPSQSVDLFD